MCEKSNNEAVPRNALPGADTVQYPDRFRLTVKRRV